MTERARTISVAQLSAAAHLAAQAALSETKTLQNLKPEEGLLVIPHWIIGIIFRNEEPESLGEYRQVAARITQDVSKNTGTAEPALYTYDRIIICGFRPYEELQMFE
jgi:hypothetical protein